MLDRKLFFGLFCLWWSATGWAQTIPSPAVSSVRPESIRQLTLEETVRLTLAKNLLLQQQRLTPQIRQQQVTLGQADFDPKFSMGALNLDTSNQSPSALGGANVLEQEQFITSTSLKKKLATGGAVSLNFNNRRVESNSAYFTVNPYYESALSLNLVQPLLQDFGIEVNEAQINIAVNNQRISVEELRQQFIQVLSSCQKTYWNLVFAQENLQVKRLLLKQAQDLLEQNKIKVNAGVLPPIEILEAQTEVADREEEIIIAQDQRQDAEDTLKNIIGLDSQPEMLKVTLEAIDRPGFAAEKPDLEAGIRSAMELRPEYARTKWQMTISKLNEMVYKNQLLPSLDLVAGYGFNGLGSSYDRSLDKLSSGDFDAWQAGLFLSLPLGNRQARSNYIISQLEQEQLRLEIKRLEQQIALEVKAAIRQIDTDRQRIESTKVAQQLAEERLKMQTERYGLGLLTSHDLLDYQVKLATAKVKHLQAVTDYNNSLVDLESTSGTTLEKFHISLK